MKKRILTGIFSLSLVFSLLWALLAGPACMAAEPDRPEGEYSGYLVTLQPQDSDRAVLMSLEEGPMLPLDVENQIYKVDRLSDIRDLVYSGGVKVVEPDYKAELFDAVVNPNDEFYQSTVSNPRSGYQYSLFHMKVQAAWDVGLSGQGVTVAVIDSGLNTQHIDAPVRIAPGRFFFYLEEERTLDSKGNPVTGKHTLKDVPGYYGYYSISEVTDTNSDAHGSISAGIIAANTNNMVGVAGIAPGVTILPIKCFTAEGEQVYHTGEGRYRSAMGGYASNLISGLDYARQNGADIINMSWGISEESAVLKTAIDSAANAGCILVAAAGNSGNSDLRYPAAYDNVISVGSTGTSDQVSSFSQRNSTVAVCAPGEYIYSLHSKDNTSVGRGSGTSFSTPAVAAVAALLKEANPAMTHRDFVALLTPENCTPVTEGNQKNFAGSGIINVEKLLDAVGYAAAYPTFSEDGVRIRGAYHPKTEDRPGSEAAFLMLVGAYNSQGHMIDSRILEARASDYNGYSATGHFPDLTGAAKLRVFFLKGDATLAAPVGAVEYVVPAQS